MAVEKLTNKVLLAVACCLVLVLVPAGSAAQGGVLSNMGQVIKKGAEGVVKGVGAGVEKTKEGVESVGHKTKRVVTREENTSADGQKPITQSATPSETAREKAPDCACTPEKKAPDCACTPEKKAPGCACAPEKKAPDCACTPEKKAPGCACAPEKKAPGCACAPHVQRQ
jgi:hypothetical protein